jgi:hypothetical protein
LWIAMIQEPKDRCRSRTLPVGVASTEAR